MIDLSALYASEYPRLCGWFARKLYRADPAVCEDLASEVFARAWAKRASYTERPGAIATSWLYRIAANLLIDHCRREHLHEMRSLDRLAEVNHEPAYTLRFEEVERDVELRAALARLTEQQRAVIVGRFYHGLLQRELTGITTYQGVKKLQERGLANLRRALKGAA